MLSVFGFSGFFAGSGLGLAIAHKLARLIGAKLEMTSAPGSGQFAVCSLQFAVCLDITFWLGVNIVDFSVQGAHLHFSFL